MCSRGKKHLAIAYRVFPGNTHDSQTLMPLLTEIKKNYGVGCIITVADKAFNSGDNITYATVLGDGYIYSSSRSQDLSRLLQELNYITMK